MTRTKNRSCNGKVRYADKDAAKAKAVALCRERHTGRYHAYLCGFCNHYHVGHKSGKGKR